VADQSANLSKMRREENKEEGEKRKEAKYIVH
jgi:hypothetical protein